MTALVVAGLVLLAGSDGALAGFRSSVGRSGRVDHRRADAVAQLRGLVLVVVLLVPAAVVALALADRSDVVGAGGWMLTVYAPYGLVVVLAIAAHLTLGWRTRFLAMALVLGPLTLLRPVVTAAGGIVGLLHADTGTARLAVVLAVTAVAIVQPLCDLLWGSGPPEITPPGGAAGRGRASRQARSAP